MTPTERSLRAQIARLEAQLDKAETALAVAQERLRAELEQRVAPVNLLRVAYDITAQQAEILYLLAKRPEGVRITGLWNHLYAGRPDGGPNIATVQSQICYLRQRVARFGLTVSLSRGGPYRLHGFPGFDALPRPVEIPDPLLRSRQRILSALAELPFQSVRNLALSAGLTQQSALRRLRVMEKGGEVASFIESRSQKWRITDLGRRNLDRETANLSNEAQTLDQKAA